MRVLGSTGCGPNRRANGRSRNIPCPPFERPSPSARQNRSAPSARRRGKQPFLRQNHADAKGLESGSREREGAPPTCLHGSAPALQAPQRHSIRIFWRVLTEIRDRCRGQAASSMQARSIPWSAPLHLAEFPKQGLGESGFPSKPARNCPLRCRTVAGRRVERERQRAPKKREPAARADTRWAKAQTGQKRKRPAAEPHRTRRAQDPTAGKGERAAKRRTRQKKRHNEKARPAAEHPLAFVRG